MEVTDLALFYKDAQHGGDRRKRSQSGAATVRSFLQNQWSSFILTVHHLERICCRVQSAQNIHLEQRQSIFGIAGASAASEGVRTVGGRRC